MSYILNTKKYNILYLKFINLNTIRHIWALRKLIKIFIKKKIYIFIIRNFFYISFCYIFVQSFTKNIYIPFILLLFFNYAYKTIVILYFHTYVHIFQDKYFNLHTSMYIGTNEKIYAQYTNNARIYKSYEYVKYIYTICIYETSSCTFCHNTKIKLYNRTYVLPYVEP